MSENGMDRPCSRPASEHACVGQQKEHHAMPKSNTAVVTIGIDPGKNTLHLVGLDARGEIVLREKVARASWRAATSHRSLAWPVSRLPVRKSRKHSPQAAISMSLSGWDGRRNAP